MESEGSLPQSQQPATCSYPDPHQYSPRFQFHFLRIHFYITFAPAPKPYMHLSCPPIPVIQPAQLTVLDLITRITFGVAAPSCISSTNQTVTYALVTVYKTLWPGGLRRRSSAARLLRSWVRIPPGAWMFVCCECCVLSGRGLCDELITRPEESYRLWCVVCDLETSKILVNEEEAKAH